MTVNFLRKCEEEILNENITKNVNNTKNEDGKFN